jgi:hypothetical protein
MKKISLVFALFMFFSQVVLSQNYLTPGLIFDFNPGDEFHYSSSSFYNTTYLGGFKVKILNKTISSNNDTIFYGLRKDSWSQTFAQGSGSTQINDTIFDTIFDTLIYTHLDSNIKFLPEYNSASFLTYQNTYNSFAAQDSSCLTTLYYSEDTSVWTFGQNQFPSYSSSFSNDWNNCNWQTSTNNSNRFALGLGVVSKNYSYYSNQGTGNSFQLVYYKKDSVSVGTPDQLLSSSDMISTSSLNTYPNPFSDDLTIKTTSDLLGKGFSIYDELGSKIFEGRLNELIKTIDLGKLNSGIYFLKVSGIPTLNQKLVKY